MHLNNKGRKGFPCFQLNINSTIQCMGEKKARDHPELSKESLELLRKHFQPMLKQFKEETGMKLKLSWIITFQLILKLHKIIKVHFFQLIHLLNIFLRTTFVKCLPFTTSYFSEAKTLLFFTAELQLFTLDFIVSKSNTFFAYLLK